jgi:hypothetical protein
MRSPQIGVTTTCTQKEGLLPARSTSTTPCSVQYLRSIDGHAGVCRCNASIQASFNQLQQRK